MQQLPVSILLLPNFTQYASSAMPNGCQIFSYKYSDKVFPVALLNVIAAISASSVLYSSFFPGANFLFFEYIYFKNPSTPVVLLISIILFTSDFGSSILPS